MRSGTGEPLTRVTDPFLAESSSRRLSRTEMLVRTKRLSSKNLSGESRLRGSLNTHPSEFRFETRAFYFRIVARTKPLARRTLRGTSLIRRGVLRTGRGALRWSEHG